MSMMHIVVDHSIYYDYGTQLPFLEWDSLEGKKLPLRGESVSEGTQLAFLGGVADPAETLSAPYPAHDPPRV